MTMTMAMAMTTTTTTTTSAATAEEADSEIDRTLPSLTWREPHARHSEEFLRVYRLRLEEYAHSRACSASAHGRAR
jgi:hypothetical protein